MASAVTQVGIVNLALSHIGQKAITSMTDGSVQQVETSKIWDFVLREALRAFNWGFAKVQAALTATTAYTPVVYSYAYVYPANCVAIRKVNDEANLDNAISGKYEVMYDITNTLQRIVTDIKTAYIEYTYLVETVTLFDSYFVSTLARRLAAELAIPLNGDKEMAKEQIAVFNTLISEAERHNASESHEAHEGNEKSEIIDARG